METTSRELGTTGGVRLDRGVISLQCLIGRYGRGLLLLGQGDVDRRGSDDIASPCTRFPF